MEGGRAELDIKRYTFISPAKQENNKLEWFLASFWSREENNTYNTNHREA